MKSKILIEFHFCSQFVPANFYTVTISRSAKPTKKQKQKKNVALLQLFDIQNKQEKNFRNFSHVIYKEKQFKGFSSLNTQLPNNFRICVYVCVLFYLERMSFTCLSTKPQQKHFQMERKTTHRVRSEYCLVYYYTMVTLQSSAKARAQHHKFFNSYLILLSPSLCLYVLI